MKTPFTNWQIWPDGPRLTPTSLIETFDGGQAFRWQRTADCLEGRWSDIVCRLRVDPSTPNTLAYAFPEGTDTVAAFDKLKTYLAIKTDFDLSTDRLPWRSDPALQTAVQAYPGLRILRQPFGECLFSFLCSSTKQIPQIKAIHEAVALSLGDALPDGSHALPTWARIAEAGEAPLRAAKLGYRAGYIFKTAEAIATNGPDWLKQIENAPIDIARTELLALPGVGRKIADCVLLFGAGRLDAFPIDTWVEKILTRAYQLEGWSLPQLQQFASAHFGNLSGYAQQYLFAAARAGLIAKAPSK